MRQKVESVERFKSMSEGGDAIELLQVLKGTALIFRHKSTPLKQFMKPREDFITVIKNVIPLSKGNLKRSRTSLMYCFALKNP
jgi:hypothetical protein